MVKVISTGYKPRPLQEAIHKRLKRFNVLVLHRRFGKTHLSCNELLDKGLRLQRKNPQMAYLAPTYGQAKRTAWDIFKDLVKDIPGVVVNESELRIELPRPHMGDKVRIMLLGAENPDALRGIYLDGVVLDEYATMNPTVWTQVVRPALSDRLGWAIFISTPAGENHFYEIFEYAMRGNNGHPPPDWYCQVYKASETGVLPRAELDAAKALMSEAEYMQEYECSFRAALVGAYYGKEMELAEEEGRITRVPYDKTVPVDTFWDLGIDDTTVIWFGQRVGREIHWIDYIEESGQSLEYYILELQKKKYVYETHYLPHDAAARELGTGKTREEVLRKKGLGNRTRIVPRSEVADGINAVRILIGQSWFDAEKCKKGISALKNYERKWDNKAKIFQQRPLHNWASHAADAMRTAAMGLEGPEDTRDEKKRLPRYQDSKFRVV